MSRLFKIFSKIFFVAQFTRRDERAILSRANRETAIGFGAARIDTHLPHCYHSIDLARGARAPYGAFALRHEATFTRSEDALFVFLAERLDGVFARGDRVAIKLHMGEPGNRYFIPAQFAKRIVECIASLGAKPCIFDSPVVYSSPRNDERRYLDAAVAHGYSGNELGCPIIVSNSSSSVKGSHMTYRICADLLDTNGVLLLTHVKGHVACGMGGAIKNAGMGCVAKETKGAIHEGGEPIYSEGCTRCGACVENCPTGNIALDPAGPRFGVTWCPGCSNCVLVCPARCIRPRVATFDELLAESAAAAHGRFKKRYSVNVLKNISKFCDCMSNAGPLIAKDIGFVCADDMVTADAATLEVIAKETGREDLFAEHNKHSPWGHVRAAARFTCVDTAVSVKEI